MVSARTLQHVVHRQAVLQAMHAAGVLGDVAADRAGDLARRVGRVVQAVAARPLRRSRGCARPAAPARCARSGSIAQDAVELRERQQHAVADAAARRPTGRCRRRAARPAPAVDGRSCRMRCDLLFGLRQRDHHRQLAVRGQAVAFVGSGVFLLVQHDAVRQPGAQRLGNLLPALDEGAGGDLEGERSSCDCKHNHIVLSYPRAIFFRVWT